ncbi:MAG: hypothetical protein SGJ11_17415 [Phycisphaerae bacterium]|nr:hypothetical protein [Phycisphaerae bacterium]
MSTIHSQAFRGGLFALLDETFEGPSAGKPSAYLDQGGGLFQILAKLDAASASTPPAAGARSVASHCEHMRFYLVVVRSFIDGTFRPVDWDESWKVQTVDAPTWQQLRAELRIAYTSVRRLIEANTTWNEQEIGGAIGLVAHTAYHVGAIRQILRVIAP